MKLTISLILLCTSAACLGQSGATQRQPATPTGSQNSQLEPEAAPPVIASRPIEQELDVDSASLSKVPSDPLYSRDPLGFATRPLDHGTDWLARNTRISFNATYTLLDQYATVAPDGVRHNQGTGRLDVNGNWAVYDHESTAGSIGLLVRSAVNIGVSQQFNQSNELGSALVLNCLEGGGAQIPISVNILYWRQDFWGKRLSFYIGKLHPNQHISLSMYNNDERTQFLNAENDGNLAIASEGIYAGGGAVELQMTRHLYAHALAVDTEGGAQYGLKTMGDAKFLEGVEMGWFAGAPGDPGNPYTNLRFVVWRNDTSNLGSGYGGGFAFEHEFRSGWAPFGRYAFATDSGTTIKQTDSIGLTNVRPFGRRGDMFGVSLNYTEPSGHTGGFHHESLVEMFYRLRLTRSTEIGPDMQVSIHPTYSERAYTTVLLGARMRIIF
jgi:porin